MHRVVSSRILLVFWGGMSRCGWLQVDTGPDNVLAVQRILVAGSNTGGANEPRIVLVEIGD